MFGSVIARASDWIRDDTKDEPDRSVQKEQSQQEVSSPTERSATDEGEHAPSRSETFESLLENDEITQEDIMVQTGLQTNGFLVALLRHYGGRRWQHELVDATGWSKATMSRRLCQLESEGEIERQGIGRKKLVFVPDQRPEALLTAHERYDADSDPETITS